MRTLNMTSLAKQDEGVSKQLALTNLITPTVFELKNGQIGCTLQLEGVSFDTATTEELNTYKRMLHQALCALGETFCIYAHTVRKKMPVQLLGEFTPGFIKDVNDKYHARFQQNSLYSNELYLTIVYKGMDSGKLGKGLSFLQKANHRLLKQSRREARAVAMGTLLKHVEQFKAQLVRFKPRLLGSEDEALGYSELLTFQGLFVNGLDSVSFKFTGYAAPKIADFKTAHKTYCRYPRGNLANYLPRKRIFIGNYIEFKSSANQSKFAAILSLKTYSNDTASIMLDTLLQLDSEFLYTNTFVMEPNDRAQAKIVKQLIRMENSSDPALSLKQQLSECRDDLASGRLTLGYHHNTVMLINDSIDALQATVNQAIKIYSDVAMVAIQESLGLESAFWAQIPGHQHFIVRASLITSLNFVDFCPLHNYKTGYADKNHLGSAVTLIETPSKTPMYFNFHAKGSGCNNDLTPGHTTLIGGNGSGKTVFMGFMDAQMTRYGGRSFFFDRDRGLEIYVRAAGGRYSLMGADHPEDTAFNPFWLQDTPSNRAFLKKWLGQLVKEEEEDTLSADVESALAECVDYAYDALVREQRNLTTVSRLLPVNFPRWHRLNQWLRSDGIRNAGEYAYLFDHDCDQLDVSCAKMGFDMTEVLSQPKSVLTAVCMYLVHCIKASLDGQRVSLYFDEGWQILDSEYWRRQLKEDLPTLRKNNAHIVLATQSPESVIHSALSATFLDNTATHIFFCNPKANYDKHYQYFNVTRSEFEFIKCTPPEKRLFLYKQSSDSAICRLNLSGLEDELSVWSGNKTTVQLLSRLRNQFGDQPSDWLPRFYEERRRMEQERT